MSILVVQLAPAGLLFGADRNITTSTMLTSGTSLIYVSGQAERPKVLKWPNHEVILGYVGQGRLAGRPTDVWLYDFIGRHLQFSSLQELADALTRELDVLFPAFPDVATILHLGGFELDSGNWKPRIFYIHNLSGMNGDEYIVGKQFSNSDEIPKYFGPKSGDQIRAEVAWPQ